MHVIPGMDEHGARLAATAILDVAKTSPSSHCDHGRDHRGGYAIGWNGHPRRGPPCRQCQSGDLPIRREHAIAFLTARARR